MNEIMAAAFFDELESIQKEAGVGDFFVRGIKGLQKGWKGLKQHRLAKAVEGPMPKGEQGMSLGAHGRKIRDIWRGGAQAVGEGGKPGGFLGGARALGQSEYAPMAATLGVGGLGAYGAGKAVFGD